MPCAYFPYGDSTWAFNYVLWDIQIAQTFFNNQNWFPRTPANTDNMLFFGMNCLDRQDYSDIRKPAPTTQCMRPENLHSLVRKTLEVNRISLCKSVFVWFCSFLPSVFMIFHFERCWTIRKAVLKPNQHNRWNQNDRKVCTMPGQECQEYKEVLELRQFEDPQINIMFFEIISRVIL